MTVLAAVLIASRILAESSIEDIKKKEAFYHKINETIRYQLQLYSKRSDCILNELKRNDAFGQVNESNFSFIPIEGGYNVTFISEESLMKDLQPLLDSANFSCTIVGFCAIILIVSVMLIVVTCVSCLSKKK